MGVVVGLAGLEPAASSLSEIDGSALCYRESSQVVRLRKPYEDGVNLSVGVWASVLPCPMRVVQSRAGEAAAKRPIGRPFPGLLEWDLVGAW
jgi:hypothetical protein